MNIRPPAITKNNQYFLNCKNCSLLEVLKTSPNKMPIKGVINLIISLNSIFFNYFVKDTNKKANDVKAKIIIIPQIFIVLGPLS
jgi:hypothetical protein